MATPKQLLSIGKKLHPNYRQIEESQKEEIRNAILDDIKFIDFVHERNDWTIEEHDQLLSILELAKNPGGFYKDKFGYRTSYNGIRTLKRAKTQLPLSKVHVDELKKCKESFDYFRKYYVKIVTRDGVARPERREYQKRLEDALLKLQDTVVLFSRQSGKTVTTAGYLLWRAIFKDDPINIGIVANKPSAAAEVLDKMKKIFVELPIWMQRGIVLWNQGNIEFDNGTRVMTSGPSSDSFRGYTINIVYCSHEDEQITIRNKETGEIEDISFRDFSIRLIEEAHQQ